LSEKPGLDGPGFLSVCLVIDFFFRSELAIHSNRIIWRCLVAHMVLVWGNWRSGGHLPQGISSPRHEISIWIVAANISIWISPMCYSTSRRTSSFILGVYWKFFFSFTSPLNKSTHYPLVSLPALGPPLA
jgi:hypothetical protein